MKHLGYMLPREVKDAQRRRVPLVMAGGTVEYHGPHCAYGCDTLIAEGLIERLSREKELIAAPSVWYSPSSYAVAGKDSGTVHVEQTAFENYVYYVFYSLLMSGWRNIYVVIHHQYEEESLMPMTLAYMSAAKRAVMQVLEETRGQGWWGSENSREYYSSLDTDDNPFGWIKVIPAMSREAQKATGYDHAGLYEASLLMALYPDTVDLSRLDDVKHWFTESAAGANAALGERMAEISVKSLKQRIV